MTKAQRMRLHRITAALFLLGIASSAATAQESTASTTNWVTNGTVEAIAEHNGSIYIGGSFRYVGPRLPYGNAVDQTTGAYVSGFATPNGPVHAVVPDGENGWYIGGAFTQVGTQTRLGLARIFSDGSLASWDPGVAGGTVYALAVSGDHVYVGGDFTSIGGNTDFSVLARVGKSGTGTPDAGWVPNVSGGSVRALAVNSSPAVLYVGGDFTMIDMIDGTPRGGLTAFEISSSSSTTPTWTPAVTGAVKALAVSGSRLIVGGTFTSIAASSLCPRLTEFSLTSGGTPQAPQHNTLWRPAPNGAVNAVAIKSDGKVYVGGEFNSIGGQNLHRLAAFGSSGPNYGILTWVNSDNGQVNNWDAGMWNANDEIQIVYTLAVVGETVYAGGFFRQFVGKPKINMVALRAADGVTVDSWVNGASDEVYSIVPSGSNLYVGGKFISVGGPVRNRLASLNASGVVTSWNPNVGNGSVSCLAVSGNTLYVGGTFSRDKGWTRTKLAAYDLVSGNLLAWEPNPLLEEESMIGFVKALAVSGNNLYVGGDFTKIAGQSIPRLVAFNLTNGNLRSTWNPGINDGEVLSIAVREGKVYVGGSFTNVTGSTGMRLALFGEIPDPAISSDNASPENPVLRTTWMPQIGQSPADPTFDFYSRVYSFAFSSDGTKVYIGGSFSKVQGNDRRSLACVEASNGGVTNWDPRIEDGADKVTSIIRLGNTILVAGKITRIGESTTRSNLASIDANTAATTINAWNPVMSTSGDYMVNAIAVVGSSVYAVGNFTATSTTPISNFASYAITDVGWIGGTGNWNVAENWNPGVVPTSTSNVTIASGTPLMNVDHTVGSGTMTISGGGSLVIDAGKRLTIGGTANFGGKSVTLKSTASGTASIGEITGSLTGATNVTVERYIKQNANSGGTGRAWRLVSIPVTGTGVGKTLRDFFMNGSPGRDLTNSSDVAAESANSGTPIVGHNYANAAAATGAGFDWIGVANQVSSLRSYVGNSSGGTFLSENVPDLSTSYDAAAQGYMVFIRGDRKLAFPGSGSSSATTLRSTGTLKTGTRTVSVAGASTSKYTLVGNPYASMLDLIAFYNTNSSVIKPSFWIWDANLAGTFNQGGYVNFFHNGTIWTTNTGSYTNPQIIESGVAWFVEPVGASNADITITESHKSNASSAGMAPFSTDDPGDNGQLYVRIEKASSGTQRQIVDGVLADFHSSFKETLTDLSDREKIRNSISQGGLWMMRDQQILSSQGLPWPGVDKQSLPLYMGSMGSQNLILRIDPRGMEKRSVKAWLKDSHLKRETEVDMVRGLDYEFTGTGSFSTDSARFELVFVEAGRPYTGGVALEPRDEGAAKVRIYPNPSRSSDVRLSLQSIPAGDYEVQVFDITGRLVVSTRFIHGGGMKDEVRFLKGRRLAPGRYLVRLMEGAKQVASLQFINE